MGALYYFPYRKWHILMYFMFLAICGNTIDLDSSQLACRQWLSKGEGNYFSPLCTMKSM